MPGSGGSAAGDSAREQASKAAASVADAQRRLSAAQQRQRAWEAGAEGERRTGEVLKALEPQGWRLLHDVHWPGRPFANIDHIAVGPGGVFVIDSKNWSGRVEVRDGVLRQNGYRRTTACEGTAAAAAAVAALLPPPHRTAVRAMMCLVGQPTPLGQSGAVTLRGLEDLGTYLRGQPVRLTQQEVATIAGQLANALTGERSPAQMTTAVLTNVGPAPRETPRSTPFRSTRRRTGTTPALPRRGRGTSRRSRTNQPARKNGPGAELIKLAVVVFLVLVVLPAWLRNMQPPGAAVPPASTPIGSSHVPAPATK